MDAGPIETFTLVFTDIEGSTGLWERSPEAMALALAHHDEHLAALVARHRGQVVKTTGDGLLACFAATADAWDAAVAAQLLMRGSEHPEIGRLRIRVALHRGPVYRRDNDLFGPTVNRCHRVLETSHGDQIVLSAAAAEDLRRARPEVQLRDLGAFGLRGLLDPEHIHQGSHSALPDEFPPLRQVETFRHNLPAPTTSFVGRDRELAEAEALLAETRLLTLMGPGGCGKTRLALQLGAEVLDHYRDGVWLVELAALPAGGDVVAAVASALAVREDSRRTLLEALGAWLRDRCLLLLLDNCEHLVEPAARLAHLLLASCPNLCVLATSQEVLQVAGETVFAVPTLPAAPAGQDDCAAVAASPAGRLFVDRAAAARPGFRLSDANAPAVAAICRRLDGIPLAIELAAARSRVLTPAQIEQRLDHRFQLLVAGSRDALPRHQTLQATVAWSYELLSPPHRALFCRLAAFSGGFDLAAAEAVGSGDQILAEQVMDLLGELVDRSLVTVEIGATEARYALLETLRLFGLDRLAEAGELDAVRDRHLAWYRQLAEQAEAELRGGHQQAWLNRLDEEQGNLQAAIEWSLAGPPTAEPAQAITAALWLFWYVRGNFTAGRAALDAALRRGGGSPDPVLARALNGAGVLAGAQGDLAAAQRYHEQALAIRRRLGDDEGQAGSHNNLGLVARGRGDLAAARTCYEESLAIYRRLGTAQGEATALSNLGSVAMELGEIDAAVPCLLGSLRLYEQLGDAVSQASVEFNLGEAHLRQQDLTRAEEWYRRSLIHRHEVGDRRGLAQSAEGLAEVSGARNEAARALFLLQAAEQLRQVVDAPRSAPATQTLQELRDRCLALLGPQAPAASTSQALPPDLDWLLAVADRRQEPWSGPRG